MNINMKNVILEKDGDWIYIKDGKEKTKLLYDDGTYSGEAELEALQQQIRGQSNWNMMDMIDDGLATVDWIITAGSSFFFSTKRTDSEFFKDYFGLYTRMEIQREGSLFQTDGNQTAVCSE